MSTSGLGRSHRIPHYNNPYKSLSISPAFKTFVFIPILQIFIHVSIKIKLQLSKINWEHGRVKYSTLEGYYVKGEIFRLTLSVILSSDFKMFH